MDEHWFDKEHHTTDLSELVSGSVENLNGIGKVIAGHLKDCGVESVAEFAEWPVCLSAVRVLKKQHRPEILSDNSMSSYEPLQSFKKLYKKRGGVDYDEPLQPCDELSSDFIDSLKHTVGKSVGALANWSCFVAAVSVCRLFEKQENENVDEPPEFAFTIDTKPTNNASTTRKHSKSVTKNDEETIKNEQHNDASDSESESEIDNDTDFLKQLKNQSFSTLLQNLQRQQQSTQHVPFKINARRDPQSTSATPLDKKSFVDGDIVFDSSSQQQSSSTSTEPKAIPKHRIQLLQKGLKSGLQKNPLLIEDKKSGIIKLSKQIEKEIQESTIQLAIEREEKEQQKELRMKKQSFVTKKAKSQQKSAPDSGKEWFGMKSSELTPEVMRDARALQLRGYINPKHNYKRDKRANFGKQFFQTGVVVEPKSEFFSSRMKKRERSATLAAELLNEPNAAQNITHRYMLLQEKYQAGAKSNYKKKRKRAKGYSWSQHK